MLYLPFDFLPSQMKIFAKFSSKASRWIPTVWETKYYNSHHGCTARKRHLLSFTYRPAEPFIRLLKLHYPASHRNTRKRHPRFRGHREIGSPSVSCCGEKSGVETDWEDSTPHTTCKITLLYNETVSSISLSGHPLRHGYTAGKSPCLSFETRSNS